MIGSEGVGKCNSNGLLLLRKCAEHELLITNYQLDSVYQLAERHHGCTLAPNTGISLNVIVRRKDRQTGCQSDKDYVWCRLLDRSLACCQQTQPAHSACTTTTRQEGAKKLDVSELKQNNKRQAFVNDLCNRLDALEHSPEDVDSRGQKRKTKAQVRSGKQRP